MSVINKWQRNYLLRIETRSGAILEIAPPFTLEMNITRTNLGKANSGYFRLYNLSERSRNEIRFNLSDRAKIRRMSLFAGYGDQIAAIFVGDIQMARSYREGTEYITEIEAYDSGFALRTATTNRTFSAGTQLGAIVKSIISDMPGVQTGKVGNFPGVATRAASYSGNSAQILSDITGGAFFIDKGVGSALRSNEFIEDGSRVFEISPDTGLLSTPVREVDIIHFEMLFEPQLNVGYPINLVSTSDKSYNGKYVVIGVSHSGVISPTMGASLITRASFYKPNDLSGVR